MIALWNVRPGLPASFVVPANWTVWNGPNSTTNASTIENGGVAFTTLDVTLGMSVGQGSTLELCDPGTSLSGSGVGVGVYGTGRLEVLNGATLRTTGTGGVDSIGYEAGGLGIVTIDGAGSTWSSETPFINVGYQGVGVLDVTNAGALNLSGYLAIEAAVGGIALVTLVGPASSVIATAGVAIDGGAGRLRIFTGATLTTGGIVDAIGDMGGAGRASVSGLGASWNENATLLAIGAPSGLCDLIVSDGGMLRIANSLQVGSGAMLGTMDVLAGGTVVLGAASQNETFLVTVGAEATSRGTIVVTGQGAILDTRGNPLLLGELGTASLVIGVGAAVTAGTAGDTGIDTAAALVIGGAAGGGGSLTIGGVGALLTVNGGGFAGIGGTATISVVGGGELIAGDSASVAGGFGLDIGAGAPLPGSTRIISGGNATLSITSGGTVIERNSFGVGLQGSAGSASVTAGVLAFAGQMVISGGTSGIGAGTGQVEIGASGTLESLGATTAGSLQGIVVAAISIGQGRYGSDAASGTLSVSGAAALVQAGTCGIVVGSTDGSGAGGGGGAGRLSIAAGGAVYCGAASPSQIAMAIGLAADSTGSVDLGGAGSLLAAAGEIDIGVAGIGTLAIAAGGTLQATQLAIGTEAGATGLLTLASGSTLAVGGSVAVGVGGAGTLLVASGAAFRFDDAITIGAAGYAQLGGTIVTGETLEFLGAAGRVDIDDTVDFHGIVAGLQAGDTLDIAGLAGLSPSIRVSGNDTLLGLSNGAIITFAGTYGTDGAQLAALLGLPAPGQAQGFVMQTAAIPLSPKPIPPTPDTVAVTTTTIGSADMSMAVASTPVAGQLATPAVAASGNTFADHATHIASLAASISPAELLATDFLQLGVALSGLQSDMAAVDAAMAATHAACQSAATASANAMAFWKPGS